MTKAVAYYRVSRAKQAASGLGLEAQREAVDSFCRDRGWEIIAPPFTEVESGKRNDRPELVKALERCKVTGATLVVAKLDRLSRNAAFLMALKDSGVDFVCADNPHANRLTIGVLALVAQDEAERISDRTRVALAAAKARGQRLGNPNGAAALRRSGKGSAAGVLAAIRKADDHALRLKPIVARLRSDGHTSLDKLAAALNGEGILTPRGGKWYASSVRNLLARVG